MTGPTTGDAGIIRWLDEATSAPSAEEVGGKGAGLAFLAGCATDTGATVPRAFAVTTAAFETAVGPDVLGRIADLVAEADASPSGLEAAAAQARAVITGLDLPAHIETAIRAAYAALGESDGDQPREPVPVAVRSSAAGEDSAEASFAGEHDSFLWVSGADAVVSRVRDCWASLWTSRAVAYRANSVQPVTPMGVVVQHMVPATAAGVFMTLNPVNGDRSKIVVEAVWGLGEPLVSGTADPDRWVVDKITGDVATSSIATKPERLVQDLTTGQGTVSEAVEESARTRPCLTSDQISQLVAVARVIEREAGTPQDGEFAVAPGPDGTPSIHLLQARPETIWANKPRESITGGKSALGSIVDTLSRGSGWTTT
ncbi:PEP/pyruvate-binding domain-containing protein [Euzebya tangerina]|uniref:PEP/pyruvate-binding domain-containing protein n=1 Tax=Euzebya tangerina TaxID=591198 RepID=UPI000E318BB5|nr:PEP/pyruvate-binding domain-containing protein [Euzebya tangerina]